MKLVFSPSVCGDLSAFLANMQITVFLLNFFPSLKTATAWQKCVIVIVAQAACTALVCIRLYASQNCTLARRASNCCLNFTSRRHEGVSGVQCHPPCCSTTACLWAMPVSEPVLGPRPQNWRRWLPSLRASFSSFSLRW